MKIRKETGLKYSLYSYVILVFVLMAGSLFPHLRVWGFNQLAWWFPYSPFIIGFILLAVGIVIYKLPLENDPDNPGSIRSYIVFAVLSTIIITALFYILRAKTHFLGDGVQLIPILVDENLAVKSRNIGEQWLHIQLFKLLSGEPEARAMLSYQLISYGSGFLSLITILFFSFKLFKDNAKRIIFTLGAISGGYALMFFGYVENYSIFAYLILLFCLLGLVGFNKLKYKLVMLAVVVLATWMHIFGLLLLPALIYLFIYHMSWFKKIWTSSKPNKIIISFVGLIALFFAINWYAQKDIVFRFSLLPPFNDQFIVEGYTLFSLKHLLDLLNLTIMTVPGIVVVFLLFFSSGFRNKSNQPAISYLLLSSLIFFIPTFVFDPDLSMPVDWDIFSIYTIPLGLYLLYRVLNSSFEGRNRIALLMVAAGFMFLVPRVLIQVSEEVSIEHAFNYSDLDTKRNIKTFRSINDYANENNLVEKYETRLGRALDLFPELYINEEGIAIKQQRRFREAIVYFQKAIQEHPGFSGAYYNMADCYSELQQLQLAKKYAIIAHGISPDNTNALNLLAGIAVIERDFDSALDYINKIFKYDDNDLLAMISLAGVYYGRQDKENYFKIMQRIVAHPDADATPFFFMGNYYMGEGNRAKAKEYYKTALTKNPDSTFIIQIYNIFPELKK